MINNQASQPSTFILRRRTPGSFLLVPCPRQERSIRCQGQLEAAAATILVACPQVVHIQEQPLQIWYRWRGAGEPVEIELLDNPPDGRRKREKDSGTSYIVPDFLVEMADGRKRLLEVKPSHRVARPLVQRKLAVGRAYAAQHDWSFHIVSEQEVQQPPLLENVRLLNRYRQGNPEANLLDQLVRHVPTDGIKLSELVSGDHAAPSQVLRPLVFYLLATGRLTCEPCLRPLDLQTNIYPGGVISWDPFDSVWAPNGCSADAPSGSSVNWLPTASSPKTTSIT